MLLFVHSHIFKYDDKNFYSEGKLTYNMWEQRYLKYFDELIVAARGSKKKEGNLNLSSGPNVVHHILPNTSRIRNRRKNIRELKKDLEYLIENTDVLVARMPSGHAYQAVKIAKKLKKPYVVEVVGDVYKALWTHGSIFGKLLALLKYVQYRKIIKQSPHLIYVTESYLQSIYPPKLTANTINISNVDIPTVTNNVLNRRIKKIETLNTNKEIKIGLIGSYASKYKGIDTAIKAIKLLKDKGYECKLFVLGSGDNDWLKGLSKKLNIEKNIIFSGSLPGGKEVFKWLDSLDIYIQPSLTEGLPRSLIEAMSRGLPCVSSSAGGMPELINENYTHLPRSENQLSDKIISLISSKENMLSQARLNFTTAQNYTTDVLNERRNRFWKNFFNKEMKL